MLAVLVHGKFWLRYCISDVDSTISARFTTQTSVESQLF